MGNKFFSVDPFTEGISRAMQKSILNDHVHVSLLQKSNYNFANPDGMDTEFRKEQSVKIAVVLHFQ